MQPRFCIPRGCLPLASLQLSSRPNDHYPRFFQASDLSLQGLLHGQLDNGQATLLIAEAKTKEQGLYAIEEVNNGLYALCRLGENIKLEDFSKIAQHGQQPRTHNTELVRDRTLIDDNKWWTSDCTPTLSNKRRKLTEDIRLRVQLKAPRCLTESSPHQVENAPLDQEIDKEPKPPDLGSTNAASRLDADHSTITSDEIFATIRAQYRQALYFSKTSLAYFAKGPLARARAHANSNKDLSLDQSDLIEDMAASILPSTTMDKKYRESIPDILRDLPVFLHDRDEIDQYLAPLIKKAKKSKNNKIGKNGFHPGEETDIARWWLNHDPSEFHGDEMPTHREIQRIRISRLKKRETLAQILLVLELLVLEQSQSAANGNDAAQNQCSTQLTLEGKRKKTKKVSDPRTLLDMMVDRLCIWQSTAAEEKSQLTMDKEQEVTSAVSNPNVGLDDLKNFCVDVVVPFYASRLPDLCSSICKKLGAPTPPSPIRSSKKQIMDTNKSQMIKPGASIQRPPPPKRPRKTLERVLTDSQRPLPPLPRSRSNSLAAPPSLLRCTTEPTLPLLKRETSDQALAAIPLNRAPSIHTQKRFSQREVDLRSAAAATEAKIKRKAAVEQELKGAIAALKKPNARMAVKELVEASEKRKDTFEKGRKRKGEPIRNPFAQGMGVQVMATPMKNRSRNALQRPGLPRMAAKQPLLTLHVQQEEEEEVLEEIPQSSAERVPESTVKASSRGTAFKQPMREVEQTPTRGHSRFTAANVGAIIPTSTRAPLRRSLTTPSLMRRPDPPLLQNIPHSPPLPSFATPTKPPLALHAMTSERRPTPSAAIRPGEEDNTIGESPLKTPSSQQRFTDRQVGSQEVVPETGALDSMISTGVLPQETNASTDRQDEENVYAALGWDDGFDDLM